MEWQVVDVKTISPLSIQVTFADGTSGKVVFETSHLTGVFEVLKDPEIFRQAYIEHGAVTWPGKIDLAPDAMYHAIGRVDTELIRPVSNAQILFFDGSISYADSA